MRTCRAVVLGCLLTLPPATAALAQFEGSDAKYAEERRQERSNWRLIKLGVGGAILLVAGGAWAVKKMRGTA